ncbi:MAG: HEAT repeat domain-containing protein [Planctomycetota bacterium]|nr:MAG: HEAT repeat domain-containing protein [Planctomycetota bacterium]
MKKSFYIPMLLLPMIFASAGPLRAEPAAELEKTYIKKIDELLPGMGHEELVKREEPQLAFEKICFEASGPDKETERKALCNAIMDRVGPEVAKPARVWLLRKVEPIGRDEVVAGLAKLMHDTDARIRELARRALQNNPSPRAAAALRNELAEAESSKWRVALINALAFRRDSDSVSAFGKFTEDDDIEVAKAAVAALGKIGNLSAARILNKLKKSSPAQLRDEIVDAQVRCAEILDQDGARDAAADIYTKLVDVSEPEHIRIAALFGLAKVQGVEVLPRLIQLMEGDDERMQLIAARCAETIPGKETTLKLAEAADGHAWQMQILLLDVLAKRGDKTALPIVKRMAEEPLDSEALKAVLRTLKHIGDGSAVKLLAIHASTALYERDVARDSLYTLPGRDVDEAILKALDESVRDKSMRAELIKAAEKRGITAAVPKLLAATDDSMKFVWSASFAALGKLISDEDFPKLVNLLVKARKDEKRRAAEIALTDVCLRKGDQEKRTVDLVAAMPKAGAAVNASLIRVLAKIANDAAYRAILAKSDAEDEGVKNAAVRALAEWKSPIAIGALWNIANTSKNKDHRTQTLHGYIRLCRLPSKRKPAETLTMLTGAMSLAESLKDKKLVLEALGDVVHPKALGILLSYLDDAELKAEAVGAIQRMAVGLSGQNHEQAVAALEKAHQAAPNDELRKKAKEVLDSIKSNCTAWLQSGPYKEKGKKAADLFDMAFAPEDPQADAEWKPLPVKDLERPGRYDFGKAREICSYFKTSVYSDKQQPAQLALGSDDGMKVWLNGEVVHAENAARGLDCGGDKVDVTLKKGWNSLLLKITQGGGNWGFCCAVKAPDGSILDGLKFKAE